MVASTLGRSIATALLAASAQRDFILSSFALASLAAPAASFSPPAAIPTTPPARKSPSAPSRGLRASPAAPSSLDPSAPMGEGAFDTGYLSARDAAALDAELMSSPGFSLEQLMELAGLSVAEAVYDVAMGMERADGDEGEKIRVLLVCGPGNNGGDGLVAARHLVHYGLDATVVYPKRSTKTHFVNLAKQCRDVGIPILDSVPAGDGAAGGPRPPDVIVDAVFGFSFRGPAPREPHATAIAAMAALRGRRRGSLLVSVDVPSGWDADGGDPGGGGLRPDALVSLTAPKKCAGGFRGRHFVGGRFLPPGVAERYGIRMPPYPGKSQVMEL